VKTTHADLVTAACNVRLNSHSPYSRFRVGAALLGASGTVYLGTNIENASFGLSNCAERTAVFRAVTDGEKEFTAIAVCSDGPEPTPPCGACRQVLLEFGPEMVVIMAGSGGNDGPLKEFTVSELVPEAFISFREDTEEGRP